MVRKAHLDQLIKGQNYWNRWRENYPQIRPNLNGLQLRGWDLSGFNLRDTELKKADLMGCNLQRANLSWANLEGVILVKTDLSEADMSQAYLTRGDLTEANLTDAYLIGTNFERANLTQANLSGTCAEKANFKRAILTGVCLQDWNIDGWTNLEDVICEYVYFRKNNQDRRPHDQEINFAPGEFSRLYQKALAIKQKPVNHLFDFYVQCR